MLPAVTTLLDLLAAQAAARGSDAAILSPERAPLTYSALHAEIVRHGAALAAMGLGRGHRIALALPDGADMAVASLVAMTWASSLPLEPPPDGAECEALLRSLRADALVARDGDASAIVRAARALGMPVVRLASHANEASGTFTLACETPRAPVAATPPRADDVALVTRTSGTTAHPRIVPTTHAQLFAGIAMHGLGAADRCLCISPLATRSAIGVSLLPPLMVGGSTVVTAGFDRAPFVDWLERFRPTYFSASPTTHAAILAVLEARPPRAPHSLRFVRSSSNALPVPLQRRIEAVTGVPVVQGYGMTEVGSIAHNRLPPGARRVGSVGVTSVAEVRIVGEDGEPCAAGGVGEIVVRGPGLMAGYEGDADASRAAFRDGWFRTGDLGHFDADGYLFLTGRLKEMINRGGRKVYPAEVDALFLRHPAVADAATFALPHPSLGQDVVTAIVLSAPAAASAGELRDYAAERLPAFKVPSSVVLVDALPRNARGKVQRRALVARTHAALHPEYVAARDDDEQVVAGVFAELLGVAQVGALDHFFHLGGDSLLAARALARLAQLTGTDLELPALFAAPTVAELAVRLRATRAGAAAHAAPPLVRRPRRPWAGAAQTTGAPAATSLED